MLTCTAHPLALWCQITGTRRIALARELGVHRSYITHICAGRRTPSVLLQRIAQRTGIPIAKLKAAA
jgi:transcriptional regulator with XRE-family HTH domain